MEPPDTQEKVLRFGCGFVMGLVVFGVGSITWSIARGFYGLAFVLIAATIFGLLALRYGDAFWDRLAQSSWWQWIRWW